MILQCPGCHKRLSLDDRNDGKMVKCPACGQQFRAGAPATRLPQPTGAEKVRPAPPPPPPKDDPGFDVVDEDYEVVNEGPAAPAPPPKPAKKKASSETLKSAIAPTKTQKLSTPDEDEPGDEPPPEDPADDEWQPKKKKKKKKKKREPEGAGAWIPYAVGLGCLLLLVVGVALAGVLAGEGGLVLFITIYLVISIPISTVILVISMVLSSAIAGGIEFGEIQVVIPKAMGLLIVVNLVSMIPFMGWVLTFPVWVFGLMFLFHLDIWEARFLFFINWLLNSVSKWFVFGLVLMLLGTAINSGMRSAGTHKGQDDEAADLFSDGAPEEMGRWLEKNEKRTIYSRSREESQKITRDLYAWGAKKVWAGNPVENNRSGIPSTKKVIVGLPADKANRKKIIDYHNQIAEKLNDVPIDDVGQDYVIIDYEAKERWGN
jgi:hypothetical protein